MVHSINKSRPTPFNIEQCDCLLLEGCDFQNYPTGGQLSFARQMMAVFGKRIALVGISCDDTPVGEWVIKEIDGCAFLFFSFAKVHPSPKKPFIPHRLFTSLHLIRYKKEILSIGVKNLFTQAPELLLAISSWPLNNLCYMFPGIGNPLEISRYNWAKKLAPLYDRFLFKALEKTNLILACAGHEPISHLITRSKGSLTKDQVVQFPTRVDVTLFRPMSKTRARKDTGINPSSPPVFVTCGRITKGKGWRFLVDCLARYINKYGEATLIFLGDGEDRYKLEDHIISSSLEKNVLITGFMEATYVPIYLNSADAALVGSFGEGWSIAMLEALACGIPIVSTNVSGANEMITDGFNGYVTQNRDLEFFSEHMNKVQQLITPPATISAEITKKYSLQTLATDLSALWPPLA